MFIQYLLIIGLVIAFAQLAVYVLYIDRRSLVNKLCASILLLFSIDSICVYYNFSSRSIENIKLANEIITSIWGLLPPLYLHIALLLVDHPWRKKKYLLYISYLCGLPIVITPLFDLSYIKSLSYTIWGWRETFNFTSKFFWYYEISPLVYMAAIISILDYSRRITDNYRIQKQATLILKSFYITAIVVFIPWSICKFSGIYVHTLWLAYGILAMMATTVYALSRYRLQSLKTSKLISDTIEQFSGFTIVINPIGEILSANNQSSLYLGYEKSELEQKNIEDYIEDNFLLKSELRKVDSIPNYSPNLELKAKCKDNNTVLIKTGINAIRNQFDEVLGYFLIFYGLSAEVKKYDKLQQAFDLTNREKDVAMLLIKGLSNQAIADALFVSLATVKTHSHNIYSKTNTKNKSELRNLVYTE
jgi:DNA-binding CsgD family transcriptional regulator